MDMRDFSKANRARCEAPNGFNHPLGMWSASDWATATVGEVGEAANFVKKLNRIRDGVPGNAPHETEEFLRGQLAKELADAYTYLDLWAQALGFSLNDEVIDKFNLVSDKVGYPGKLKKDAHKGST